MPIPINDRGTLLYDRPQGSTPGTSTYTNPTGSTVPGIPQPTYQPNPYPIFPEGYYGSGSTPSGSGSRGSSGGGYTAASSMALENAFIAWFGYVPSGLLATAKAKGWTEDNIRRAAANDPNSYGAEIVRARSQVRQIGALWYSDPSAVPDSIVNSIIADGLHTDADYLRNTYFPALNGAGATNPAAKDWVDYWVDATGRPMSQAATEKMSDIISVYGFTDDAMNAWQSWVNTTESAITGNYGATIRVNIANDFNNLLGRNPTQAELDPNGSFWNLNDAARYEAIKSTPDYQAIYGGKPAWMSEGAYIDYARALSSVYTWYYGSATDVTTLRTSGGGTTTTAAPTGGTVPMTTGATQQPVTAQPTIPEWKSLSNAQFAADLATYGITVSGTGASATYTKDGKTIKYDQLMQYLPSDTYYRDNQGYHYVQEEGAVNPSTGKPATITKPASLPNPDTSAIYPTGSGATGLGVFNITNVSSPEVDAAIASGLSPSDIQMLFKAHEEAIYLEGAYSDTLMEAFGSGGFSHEQWEALARGGEGSGAMRVQLMEAQNRVAFREVWRNYFGTDPGPADYDYITSNYVSPGEFANRMAAKESAKAKIEEVNDLMSRVYGTTVSLADLENMAMGGKDSGVLQAQLTQAAKLDQYRWIFKQYYDREPTPQDYAELAGYSGPQELQWEIVTKEKIAEFAPDIQEVWAKAYDGAQLTDQELQALLGEQEGYGDLRRRLKDAEEEVDKEETSIRQAHTAPKVTTWYVSGPTGAIQEGMKGLADIGA